MSFQIAFPKEESDKIVETELMREIVARTMAVHRGGAVVVWTGRARNGKTKTAEWMVRKIEEAHRSSPHGFRAVHYEAGEIDQWAGNEMKRGIRSLYHATVGKLSEGVYRQTPVEDLAAMTVHALRAKNVQMVLIDEAGLLSLDAIRGMILVRNVAQLRGWTLSLVLIGMDDLPIKMRKLPQIRHRIHEWLYFKPYTLKQTYGLLAALEPHFATLAEEDEQVKFMQLQFNGLPGLIVPFLRRVRHQQSELGLPISLVLLRAVHMLMMDNEIEAVRDANGGFEGDDANDSELLQPGPQPSPRRGPRPSKGTRPVTPPETSSPDDDHDVADLFDETLDAEDAGLDNDGGTPTSEAA